MKEKDFFSNSVNKHKEDLEKLKNILNIERENNMGSNNQDLKIGKILIFIR